MPDEGNIVMVLGDSSNAVTGNLPEPTGETTVDGVEFTTYAADPGGAAQLLVESVIQQGADAAAAAVA
jgi:hypothetical protein